MTPKLRTLFLGVAILLVGCGGGSDGDSHNMGETPPPVTKPPEPEPQPGPEPAPAIKTCVVDIIVVGNFFRWVDIFYTDPRGDFIERDNIPNEDGEHSPGTYILANVQIGAGVETFVFVNDGEHGYVPLDGKPPYDAYLVVNGRNQISTSYILPYETRDHGGHTPFFADDQCELHS